MKYILDHVHFFSFFQRRKKNYLSISVLFALFIALFVHSDIDLLLEGNDTRVSKERLKFLWIEKYSFSFASNSQRRIRTPRLKTPDRSIKQIDHSNRDDDFGVSHRYVFDEVHIAPAEQTHVRIIAARCAAIVEPREKKFARTTDKGTEWRADSG